MTNNANKNDASVKRFQIDPWIHQLWCNSCDVIVTQVAITTETWAAADTVNWRRRQHGLLQPGLEGDVDGHRCLDAAERLHEWTATRRDASYHDTATTRRHGWWGVCAQRRRHNEGRGDCTLLAMMLPRGSKGSSRESVSTHNTWKSWLFRRPFPPGQTMADTIEEVPGKRNGESKQYGY